MMIDQKPMEKKARVHDPALLRELDRGLDDIEAGRTMPHDEAMTEVRKIREARRAARENAGAVSNA